MPPNRHSDENDPNDWFYSAMDRLRPADSLWRTEGFTHSGIELLQEAMERYLKGFLIAKGLRLARTHDLRRLVQDACAYHAGFSRSQTMSKELTEEFFAHHYPGGDWTSLGGNYESLRQQAGGLIELIKQILPQYFAAAGS